ncbi:MAG: SsrA-binding protein SmpB [Caldilineaceae bacterium]|nr:SsrA-binding protein SmpB [Caldilineaceae bacterium]
MAAKSARTKNERGPVGPRTVATNRRARFNYHLLEEFDAGIQLLGTEIKSIRQGQVNLGDGFVMVRDGEAWLHNVHIAPYSHGNRENHEEMRPRKLLLNKREIRRIAANVAQKGLTTVPVRLYISNHGLAKVVVALAKGKQQHDKRDTIAQRDAQRSMARARKQMYDD